MSTEWGRLCGEGEGGLCGEGEGDIREGGIVEQSRAMEDG